MAKIKLPKKNYRLYSNILNTELSEELNETYALKLSPQEKIKLEVILISIKTDVSR